ncbi:MAG: acylphosphatase [Solirubrobacterales bacterium]
MSGAIRRRVLVEGRVQGVWFRDSTRRIAEREGVAGWVRNRADGALEAVFEGPEDAVRRLVEFCGTGPEAARVRRVGVSEEPPAGESSFRVL